MQIILSNRQARIKFPRIVKCGATLYHRQRLDMRPQQQIPDTLPLRNRSFGVLIKAGVQDCVLFIDYRHLCMHKSAGGMRIKKFDLPRQLVGAPKIIGIQVSDKFSARSRQGCIPCRRSPLIGLIDVPYRLLVGPYQRLGAIRRSIIDDNDFEISVGLSQRRVDSPPKKFGTVISRNYDGYTRHVGMYPGKATYTTLPDSRGRKAVSVFSVAVSQENHSAASLIAPDRRRSRRSARSITSSRSFVTAG